MYRYTRQTIDFDFMLAQPNYERLHDYLVMQGFREEGRMGQFGSLVVFVPDRMPSR